MVIDFHTHCFPDHLAPKAVERLSVVGGGLMSYTDGTLAGLRHRMAEDGIDTAVVLNIATKPQQQTNVNNFAASINNERDIFAFGSVHPDAEDALDELERIKELGLKGVKFHPEYQEFGFNDPSMDNIWAAMAERNLVAYLHAGGERVFAPPYRSSPSDIRTLHRRFPKLKIAAAHLGGFGMWDETEETLVGEDVTLDLSHTFFWMPHERIERIIRNHGARRILFGTDSPWQEQSRILGAFAELPLSESDRRTICYENAKELFNLKI